MHSLAQHLQSQGRGNDSVLVHMTPREVGGLQSLAKAAGGSLTINPQTGLPEAGFLDSILPMIAGGLLMATGIGAPIGAAILGSGASAAAAGALGSGLLVGGGTAAVTGDLGKGLMAGLGAYGGAGLGSALGLGGAGAAGSSGSGGLFGNLFGGGAQAGAGSAGALAGETANQTAMRLAQTQGMNAANAFTSGAAPAAGGLGSISTMGKVALGGSLLGAMEPSNTPAAPAEEDKYPYKGPYTPAPRQVQFPTNRDPNDSSEFRYFTPTNPVPNVVPYQQRDVGQVGQRSPIGRGQVFGRFDPTINLYAKGGDVDLEDGSFVVDARTVSEMGNGSSSAGQEVLSRMGGRPIQGPGDGVSDSIRANIGGTQEARVARDEVKFSPDAVKRVGGGSAKKGAQRLYALMHQAQQARKKAKRGEDTGLAALVGK